jgi:EAL domain-containing protein (putative c-di-GMP-specific phosphodiesterase class I)
MYQAKRLGPGAIALFDEELRDTQADRLAIAQDLRGAASRGELRLYYQPLVNLRTGNIRGVEALVRWQHPTLGLLMPDTFIDIAEDTGAIIELGEWVLYEACRVLADWELTSPAGRPLRISVNVSALQITDGRLVDTVTGALESALANPSLLTIEVTESAVMADVDAATVALRALRSVGVHLAIDDFGTGYSSLTYLKQFPIHELKLDKSFVDGVGTHPEDSAIVAAVVNLARAVDLEVVAEGVESARQSAVLRTLGCDYGQGYVWQRPVPRDVIEPWIRDYAGADDPAHPPISPSGLNG